MLLPFLHIKEKSFMKKLMFVVFTIFSLASFGQDKYNYTHFNKLTVVKGTSYVIADIENRGKLLSRLSSYLLFIDTRNGDTTQFNLPNNGYCIKYEQKKIDSLDINTIILIARTFDLDGNDEIDWRDPEQFYLLSPDGKKQIKITDDKLFVDSWVINDNNGTIVITGHYDSNNNGKLDKNDKNEISIYDIKTYQLIKKI